MSKLRKRGNRSRAERHMEATERNTNWNSLTPQEQIERLDVRLGIGIGATKQRRKIQYIIDHPQVTKQKKSKDKKAKKRGKNV
ncbi:MAG: hypothetical protein H8E55_49480 [Pelagibacterales bacterium]|nr:hypothetical protein [Pelagibacterales bacterium]